MLALTVDDLIEYTTWQRARWHTFLREHPAAMRLDAGPHGDGRFATVGDLVKVHGPCLQGDGDVVSEIMHRIQRHWAQVATICRQHGLVAGWHDFITSPAFGGSFGEG